MCIRDSHEGAAVRQMEKRGIQTNIGILNREIKAANSLMKSIRQLIKNLKGWIIELSEKRKELNHSNIDTAPHGNAAQKDMLRPRR